KDSTLYSTDVVEVKVEFTGKIVYYRDKDGDGFGDDTETSDVAEEGYVEINGDCDDNDDTVYPGAMEILDGKDNNCNGLIDEDFPTSIDVPQTFIQQFEVLVYPIPTTEQFTAYLAGMDR